VHIDERLPGKNQRIRVAQILDPWQHEIAREVAAQDDAKIRISPLPRVDLGTQ